ncbi:MAG: hypothetical protein K2L83_05020 [Muribaculaceae bacterium]|nr:hypothetical protein [Muribaculaceae bacterium]
MITCDVLQQSISWCEGAPSVPGIRREIYFTAISNIVSKPVLPEDELHRPTDVILQGDYVTKADKVFYKAQGLPNKNQYTSDPQGEQGSQTQLNKLSFIYPSTDEEASRFCLNFNNTPCVVLFCDNCGRWRVLRNHFGLLKAEIKQDSGQSVTGETGTTIEFSDTDKICPPFFRGKITTEDGEISLGDDDAA